jgi:ABC-type sugar transport system substrate-binding protein
MAVPGKRAGIGGDDREVKMLSLKCALLGSVCVALASFCAGPAAASADKPTIIMVSGPLTDPFFSALKKGFDDGAAAMKVDAQYSTISNFDNVQSDLVHLVEASASRHPDALIVGDFFPDAMNPSIKAAAGQGVAIIINNSGEQTWKDVGALTYIGEDPRAMGAAAGELAVKAGAKFGICVNHVPGNPALEQRCAGYDDALKAVGGGAHLAAEDEIQVDVHGAGGHQRLALPQTDATVGMGKLDLAQVRVSDPLRQGWMSWRSLGISRKGYQPQTCGQRRCDSHNSPTSW